MTVYPVSVTESGSIVETATSLGKFSNVNYEGNNSPSFPTVISYLAATDNFVGRASTATYFDSTGTLQTASINAPRNTYDPATLANLGILLEPAAINVIRNSTMAGASVGTLPIAWARTVPAGITGVVSAVGIENGMNYVDFAMSGTATASGNLILYFDGSTFVPVATFPQTATISMYIRADSALTGFGNPIVGVQQYDSNVAYYGTVSGSPFAIPIITSGLTSYRISTTLTTNAASAEWIRPILIFAIVNGTSYNGTFRIGHVQCEYGSVATSPILTSTVRITRQADVYQTNISTDNESVGLSLNIGETGSAVDSTDASSLQSSSVYETGILTDSALARLSAYPTIAETGSLTDSPLARLSAYPTIAETGIATDAASLSFVYSLRANEVGNATDSVGDGLAYNASIAEAISALDSISYQYIPNPPVQFSDIIIRQLRQYAPIFQNRVVGAASPMALANDQTLNLITPYACVIPLGSTTEENTSGNSYRQNASEAFGIFVCLTNTDDRGQSAELQIDIIERQLLNSIANFIADSNHQNRGFNYSGKDSNVGLNGNQLWVQFTFDFDYIIGPDDVWKIPSVPLNEIAQKAAFQDVFTRTNIVFGADKTDDNVPVLSPANISDKIIQQIKRYSNYFSNVTGAASLDAFWKNQSIYMQEPSAVVVNMGCETSQQKAGVGYRQIATADYSIFVCLDNSVDLRGQNAFSNNFVYKWDLISVLANWIVHPSHATRGLAYGGYRIAAMNAAQLFIRFDFSYEYQITDSDVWIIPSTPLKQINETTTFSDVNTGAQIIPATA